MLPWSHAANAEARRAEAELDELVASRFAAEAVAALQARKLDRLWQRAATTAYYCPLVQRRRADLAALAETPRAALRDAPAAFLTPAARTPLRYYETSGTSGGAPVAAPRLTEDVVWNVVTLGRAWAGVLAQGTRAAVLLPSDVAPVGDTVAAICEYLGLPYTRCFPFTTGVCDFDRVQDLFGRFEPGCLFAAPGLLLALTRALKRRGALADAAAGVERVMLLGEVATPSLQAMLARQWKAGVLDASYGSTETGTVAAVCAANRLHVLVHAFISEVVPDGGGEGGTLVPATPGTSGRLAVTALNAFARPLLRYGTGDRVEVAGDCPCGSPLPTLLVRGRAADALGVGAAVLDAAAVEAVVYGIAGVTGYLIDVHADAGTLTLTLERDIDCDADDADLAGAAERGFAGVGVALAGVRVVHQLPAVTKSGGAQKNWKKTNVRVVR